tara:strand:+ start:1627 stop:2919 length:1293 start_codon:yes stop_codon:yes gene_type:complete
MNYCIRVPVVSLFCIAIVLFSSCQSKKAIEHDGKGRELIQEADAQHIDIKVGAQVLLQEHLDELRSRSIGLVMNPTSRVEGVHMLDTLMALGIPIKALFAAEHGFRGNQGAGEMIQDGLDEATGLTVFSLYGATKKPTTKMLENIDVLLFDMQDVGARFYTYNSTMKYIIEASAEQGVDVWILDRPNPLGGDYVAGWVLETEYSSFVGTYPIPIAHGLTLGELAQMALGEGWFDTNAEVNLRVIPVRGWQRNMKWSDTQLEWVPPSPNLPTFEHAYAYVGTCFFEGTTLSEGRGTEHPFLMVGGVSTDIGEDIMFWSDRGVHLLPSQFMPVSMHGKALRPKGEGIPINGIKWENALDHEDPLTVGLRMMQWLMERSPEAEYNDYLYLLAGTDRIDELIRESIDLETDSLDIDWGIEFESYIQKRTSYLMY